MTLLMRDQENQEIGRREAREESIKITVRMLKSLEISNAVILEQLMKKFLLTEEEATSFVNEE